MQRSDYFILLIVSENGAHDVSLNVLPLYRHWLIARSQAMQRYARPHL